MKLKAKAFFTEPILFYIIVINYLKPDSFSNIGLPDTIVRISAIWDRFFGILVVFLCLLAMLKNHTNKIADVIVFYGYKIIGTVLVTYMATHVLSGGGAFAHLRKLSIIWYLALALKYNY
ncbi:MAG TPA: hypothetical protein DHV77_03500, partial [Erysipelotrichaceae bacterium]|nr:hypothetical protein [Erysipelotrichaceae bacterium]